MLLLLLLLLDAVDKIFRVSRMKLKEGENLCPCRATCLVYCDGTPDGDFLKFFNTSPRVGSKRVRMTDVDSRASFISEY